MLLAAVVMAYSGLETQDAKGRNASHQGLQLCCVDQWKWEVGCVFACPVSHGQEKLLALSTLLYRR